MNRQEAKALGYKRFQGSPCKYGHGVERYTSNGGCVTCCKIQTTTWNRHNNYPKRWQSKGWGKDNRTLRKIFHSLQLAGRRGYPTSYSESVGYEPRDLISHIESLWQKGMSWENYGDWEFDHIKPISAFVKEGVTDPAIVHSLDNLQPLWKKDNMAKGSKHELPKVLKK